MKVQKKNRMRMSLPKVGIRPTIDGRQAGIRESLEEQTMAMAENAAQLIEAEVLHACGLQVECVIADTSIGGVSEAASCADKFARAGVGVSLTVTPCWCYGTEVMDTNPHIPKAIWGFNGTERPGAVYLAATQAAYNQKGLPVFSIYGQDVQDQNDRSIPNDVKEKILQFIRAAIAVVSLRGNSYLSIGGTSMGIMGSTVDPHFFQKYLDMRTEFVDMSELIRRLELGIFDKNEYEQAYKWVKKNCKEQEDNTNPPELRRSVAQREKDWQTSIKMTLIFKDLLTGNSQLAEQGFREEAMGHNALLGGFQGQRSWTDFMPNGDFSEALLNSSFDWTGTRQPYILATENDSLNGVSMLFNHLLTGRAQIFSDVRTYWSPAAIKRVTGWEATASAQDGLIHLINSGPTTLDATGAITCPKTNKPMIKKWWNVSTEDQQRALQATEFCVANGGYFKGGGFSTDFTSAGGMPMTMLRLNLVAKIGPVLQIAEGWTVELPIEVHDILDERTDKTWPSTWFRPRLEKNNSRFESTYAVMSSWGANHAAVSYGHIGAELITLASMLRIPVAMHNIEQAKVFRPAYWAQFGADLEGSDYRACNALGPLY